MRVEELSVGDWVQVNEDMPRVGGKVFRTTTIMGDGYVNADREYSSIFRYDIHRLSPISLTPEILEQNGETNKDYLAWLIAGRAVVEKEPTGEYSVHIYDAAIDKVLVTACAQYVHQLQHALRLAGIEKEIEV